MIRSRYVSLALVVLSSAAWAANPAIPTDQELQQMLERGDFRSCLQQTARVLALTGDFAKPYDVFTLQMRRGECLLNLNDPQTALSAYSAALNVASTPPKADEARAMIALIKASRGMNYVPAGGGGPIAILPMDSRKRAMAALCNDRLAANANDIRAALNSPSLAPTINFFPQAQDLHALEVVGTGHDEQTQPMLLALGEHAREVITQELQALSQRVDTIQSRANQMVASGNSTVTINGSAWWLADTRTGLSADDRNDLRGTLNYLGQIVTVSQQGKQAAQSFGRDGKVWDPIISEGQQIYNRAQGVLNAE